jgi:hypothetical protein
MKLKKKQKIEERLEMIEQRLANAHGYVAQNVNVEGKSRFHFDDWLGKSGHPLWMWNYMIPTLMKTRAKLEKVLRIIGNKAKDKKLTKRKRHKDR